LSPTGASALDKVRPEEKVKVNVRPSAAMLSILNNPQDLDPD